LHCVFNTEGNKMKKILLAFYLLTLISFNTCDDNPVNVDDVKPGRRDYTWTVDTLDGLNSPRYRMWGSSPSDVWTISHSAWEVSISHFDGGVWTSYGVTGLINPFSIYGFSNNNIFIGAENGQIWKYDGSNWELFAGLTKNGHNDIVFDNIWGESSNNFYAFGAYPDENGYANNSVIAQHQSENWIMLNTSTLYGIVEKLYKNHSDNKIYLQVIGGHNFTDSTKIYEYVNGDYQKLYGNIWTKGLQADISLINSEVYFIIGNEIAKRKNNQFQTLLQVDNPNFYQRIWGRNSMDIFLLMTDGLSHFNGSDIEYLFYFNVTPRTQIYGAAVFDDDVFFLVYEAQTGLSLVYHGILK
jgi:hypothetical protein